MTIYDPPQCQKIIIVPNVAKTFWKHFHEKPGSILKQVSPQDLFKKSRLLEVQNFSHSLTLLRLWRGVTIKQELYNSDVETTVRLNDLLCDGGDEPLEDVHAGGDAVVLHKRLPLLLKEYLNIFYAAMNTELYSTLHFYKIMNTEMYSTLHLNAAMNTELYSTLHFYKIMNTEMYSTLHLNAAMNTEVCSIL
jgi:hypothetical protein